MGYYLHRQSYVGWATLFCPPLLSVNGGQTIKLFAHPTGLFNCSQFWIKKSFSYSQLLGAQHEI
jgi:hypothetical protein